MTNIVKRRVYTPNPANYIKGTEAVTSIRSKYSLRTRPQQQALATFYEYGRVEKVPMTQQNTTSIWQSLIDDADKAFAAKQYLVAERLYHAAITIAIQFLSHNHLLVAQLYIRLGELNMERYEFGRAEIRYKQALCIYQRKFGNNHIDTAILLNTISYICHLRGNNFESDTLKRRAERIIDRVTKTLESAYQHSVLTHSTSCPQRRKIMPNRDLIKPLPEAQSYLCQECDSQFFYLEPAELKCPKCGNRAEGALVQLSPPEPDVENE